MLNIRKFNTSTLAVFECFYQNHVKHVHGIKVNNTNNNLLNNKNGPKIQYIVQLRYKQHSQQEPQQMQLQQQHQNQPTNQVLGKRYKVLKDSTKKLELKGKFDEEQLQQLSAINPNNKAMAAAIKYNIKWIYAHLRHPSLIWFIASQITVFLVGVLSKVLLIIMNSTQVHNKRRLIDLIWRRPLGVPLITISNHHSCFDDPGLWGVLPMRIVCNTFKIRWALAANDICFTNKWHSLFFMHGKCIPVIRGVGVYQEAVDVCIQKCALGLWVHVFPEGRVNVDKGEIRLKWGVGRIIYESPKIPIILPIWHEGMDEVLPNVEPYRFSWRKKVTLNVGEQLDLNSFIQDLKNRNVPEEEARKLITDKIQTVLYHLRLETQALHAKRK